MEVMLNYNETPISLLDVAEHCIKVATPFKKNYLKIRQFYRVNQIFVDCWCSFPVDSSEYIIYEAYVNFIFVCGKRNVRFYKKCGEEIIEIKDKSLIRRYLKTLFEGRGVLDGEEIYISKNVYGNLPHPDNKVRVDSPTMRILEGFSKYLARDLNVEDIPPLTGSVLKSRMADFSKLPENFGLGITDNQKKIVIYLFPKTK